MCEKSPHLWAELPFAPRRGAAALALKCALPFPTMSLPRSHWRRCVVLRLSPTAASGTPIGGVVSCFAFPQRARLGLPTPPRRARCDECASIVPCLSSRSAGRSPFKVCSSAVDVCFAFLTDFPRGRGRRGRRSRPKPSAAFLDYASLPKNCRARFSASGGRRPLSIGFAPAGRGGRLPA